MAVSPSIPGFDFLSLSDCVLCPRACHVNRLRGERGFCGEAGVLRAARAALYYNEEPVISGRRGSGAIFFTGCSLGCVYCQNRQISRSREDKRDALRTVFRESADMSVYKKAFARGDKCAPRHSAAARYVCLHAKTCM